MPFSDSEFLNLLSSAIFSIPKRIFSVSVGLTNIAAPPEISGREDVFEAIVGQPQLMASSSGKPNPSERDKQQTKGPIVKMYEVLIWNLSKNHYVVFQVFIGNFCF